MLGVLKYHATLLGDLYLIIITMMMMMMIMTDLQGSISVQDGKYAL
jgi:hypothetical protein